MFPNSHRINRGNYVVKELAEACRANDITDLIVLHEHRGTPGAFIQLTGYVEDFYERCYDTL